MSNNLRMSESQLAAYEAGKRAAKEKPLVAPERDQLSACMDYLAMHSAVAWHVRMNSGAMKTEEGRYVRFGFVGCSDIIGQLKSGKFLAFEVKRKGEKPTDDQLAFIAKVNLYNGLGGWGTIDDLMSMMVGL